MPGVRRRARTPHAGNHALKLLFDQNLSPRLVTRLADPFPDSSHVQDLGLGEAVDDAVWDHARHNGFCIVSKDEDYNDFSLAARQPTEGDLVADR